MPQLLKPAHLEPTLCNRRSHCSEGPAHCREEWPLLAAPRESLHTATKTQCSQKIIKRNKFKKKEIENLNRQITSKEIETVIKNLQKKKKFRIRRLHWYILLNI